VKRRGSSRPGFPKVSEEMKAWCVALADEAASWPHVSVRPLFGFTALYREDKMFAALPRTRGWESAKSLAFKLETRGPSVSARLKEDSLMRIWSSPLREARWFSFDLSSAADIRDALDWLGRAYNAAAKSKKSR
jgi:hypothetical protein